MKYTKNVISNILNRRISHDRRVILVKTIYENCILLLINIRFTVLDLRKFRGNFTEISDKFFCNFLKKFSKFFYGGVHRFGGTRQMSDLDFDPPHPEPSEHFI